MFSKNTISAMIKKTFVTIICLVLLTNCATRPSSISPQYVSSKKYEGYSCRQLGEEKANVQQDLISLTASMESKRAHDTGMVVVGLFLFFITLFFTNGKNPADDLRLAQLQGEIKAIDKALVTCSTEKKNKPKKDERPLPAQPIIINNRNS